MSSPTLPDEIWETCIFPYLWEDDLARARRVCKDWWCLINSDRLWKALAERHGIREDTVLLQKDDGGELKSCKWFNICSSYFNKLNTKWKSGKFEMTQCPNLVEGVTIRMPYMIRSYDSFNIVEILRMINGNFKTVSRLRIPGDNIEASTSAFMMTHDLLVVCRGGLCILYKRVQDDFKFTKAFRYVGNDRLLETCVDVDKFDKFALEYQDPILLNIYVVNDETIWFHHGMMLSLYIYNHKKSEVVGVISAAWPPRVEKMWIPPVNNYVCCNADAVSGEQFNCSFDRRIRVYSSDGRVLLWETKGCRVVWDDFGCAVFSAAASLGGTSYFRFKTRKAIKLNIEAVNDVKLDSRTNLAYCTSARGFKDSGTVSCWSLSSGDRLWETISKAQLTHFTHGGVELIMSKYVCSLTMGKSGDKCLQIHSALDGSLVKTFSIGRTSLTFFTDSTLVLKQWVPRGGTARVQHTILNFLADRGGMDGP